jgi:hypothetical protein
MPLPPLLLLLLSAPTALGSGAAECSATFDIVADREVSDKYVSFTLDVSTIHNGTWGSSYDLSNVAYRELIKPLAPAYMRMGGTGEDALTYDFDAAAGTVSGSSGSLSSGNSGSSGRAGAAASGSAIPQRVLTKQLWDEVNAFAAEVGLEIVFGLNNFQGWEDTANHTLWDSSNAKALILYTLEMSYPVVGWELGASSNLNCAVDSYTTPLPPLLPL